MRAVVAEVAEVAGGYQLAVDQTIEIEGGAKPARRRARAVPLLRLNRVRVGSRTSTGDR